eukprot:145337-Chlamydomonas_euryale.AAC.1
MLVAATAVSSVVAVGGSDGVECGGRRVGSIRGWLHRLSAAACKHLARYRLPNQAQANQAQSNQAQSNQAQTIQPGTQPTTKQARDTPPLAPIFSLPCAGAAHHGVAVWRARARARAAVSAAARRGAVCGAGRAAPPAAGRQAARVRH